MQLNGDVSNLTILINSCNAFSDMWDNNIFLYDKYWKKHPDILISTDSLDPLSNIKNVVAFEGSMSARLYNAVKSIETKYVFLSFDDYYVKKNVDSERIYKIIEEMKKNNIDYCRLYTKPKIKGKKIGALGYKKMPLVDFYEVNFYPGIWKKDSLLKLLNYDEDVWKLEARLTRRAKENEFYCICLNNKNIFEFVDVVRKGKYLRSAYRYLKKNDLYISDRKVRTVKETIFLNTRIFISDHTPKRLKIALKKKGNKRGKVYYSDYADTND